MGDGAHNSLERALQESEERLRLVLEGSEDGFWDWNIQSGEVRFSQRWAEMLGYRLDEIEQNLDTWKRLMHPEDWDFVMQAVNDHLEGRSPHYVTEHRLQTKDGGWKWILDRGKVVAFDETGRPLRAAGTHTDITGRKQAEERNRAEADLLRICHFADSPRDLMRQLIVFFKQVTGCQSVAVRLHQGGDYPYYETSGFDEAFMKAEYSLCIPDPQGSILRDSGGNPVLECMCGNILCARFDPSKPFFTPGGSFWTNSTTRLQASTSEADRQARTRNRCNGEGYESVALLPLRAHGATYGLFQFNDRQEGRFSLERIQWLEHLVNYAALALANLESAGALRESEKRFEAIFDNIDELVYVADTKTYEVIYKNRAMEENFGPLTGQKCYEYLQRRDAPCPFCTNDRILGEYAGRTYAWEFQNEVNHHWYRCIDKAIVWPDGRTVRYEMAMDITDRKQAEEELRHMEALLNEMQRLTRLGAWEWEAASGKMNWSEETYHIHGMSPGDIPQGSPEHIQRSLECYDPPGREELRAAFERCTAGGIPYELELPFTSLQGEKKWVRTMGKAFVEGGQVVRVIGNLMDITERKRADEALRKSEERYHLIDEASRDQIYSYDRQGRFTHANSSLCRLLGLTYDEIVGKTHAELGFPAAQCAEWDAYHRRVYETGASLTRETATPIRGGEVQYFEVTLSPMHDMSGAIIGIAGTTRDITEHKQADAALHESEERYRSLFENNHAAMLLIRPDDGSIVDANAAALDFYGWSRKEILGMTIHQINTLTEEEVHQEMTLARKQQRKYFLFRHLQKNGEIRDVEVFSGPIQIGGETLLFSIIHDITARRQAETKVAEQVQELRRWYNITLGREERILELKDEVNSLLAEAGKPARYTRTAKEAYG